MINRNYQNIFSEVYSSLTPYSSLEERANDPAKSYHYVVASVSGGPKRTVQYPDVYSGFGTNISRFRR